jgi:hypothetical protein
LMFGKWSDACKKSSMMNQGWRNLLGFCVWSILFDRTRLTAINQSLPDVDFVKQIFFCIKSIETYSSIYICPNNSSFPSSAVKLKSFRVGLIKDTDYICQNNSCSEIKINWEFD